MEQESREKLITLAAAAEVVSFDVFDTLFVRALCDPEDIFDIMGERFNIPGFRQMRRSAQARAFQTMHANDLKEITLDSIYASFDKLPVPAEELKQAELQLELDFTLPNCEVTGFFAEFARSRRVVITSDMYLPRIFFDALLRKNDLPAVPLFISSERNATKRDSGELFDIVASELQVAPERILHIGDNELSDIKRASEKRLSTFLYIDPRRAALPSPLNLSSSIAYGSTRAFPGTIAPGSFEALGFNVGGPAAFGFLHWIKRAAARDAIDLILFTSRDGYVLERMEKSGDVQALPRCEYFKSSRTALTLAATVETNFEARMQFFLSGAEALSAFELLERIGVVPPADHVMSHLGLGPEVRLTAATVDLFRSFLWSCRWEILKTCRAARAGLFTYLRSLGVTSGMRIAMVDVGWNGTTQEALQQALDEMFEVDLFGYYLCLTEQPECVRRRASQRMDALVSARSVKLSIVERMYSNRVAVELFFSAPHGSVIGYGVDMQGGVVVVEDFGRGTTPGLSQISAAVSDGIEQYSAFVSDLFRKAGIVPDPLDMIKPLLDFVQQPGREARQLLSSVTNFDAWASSRNKSVRLNESLT